MAKVSAIIPREPRPPLGEQTGPQSGPTAQIISAAGLLPGYRDPLPATYDTYRLMRADPSIALARMATMAPIEISPWSVESVEGTPEPWVEFVREQFDNTNNRPLLLHECLRALDFGWAAFEKVYPCKHQPAEPMSGKHPQNGRFPRVKALFSALDVHPRSVHGGPPESVEVQPRAQAVRKHRCRWLGPLPARVPAAG